MTDSQCAFEDALDAAEEAKGTREKVIIRGKRIDALFYEWGADKLPAMGGEADGGIYRIGIRVSDYKKDMELLEPVEARGLVLAFMSAEENAMSVDLLLGDPAAEVTE